MKKYLKYSLISLTFVGLFSLNSCEKFFEPELALNVQEENLLKDYYEYRALEMGMYALQQELVEQIIILGELRADLLTVTPNASAELIEIHDFNISKNNKYADPTNFFKLISATNNFIRLLEENHPEVLDPESDVTNYDRMYGEALCMRAWAYFTAVRIYGKVPLIHESLVTMNEIDSYVNSSGTYIDSVYITFSLDGYENDTIYNKEIELEKQYFDTEMVIDKFTNELENKIKAVGVNHYIDNNDNSWEITIWNTYAMNTLLGSMYLTQGNLDAAVRYFHKVVLNTTENYRYQLTNTFGDSRWKQIFSGISNQEHIYIIEFNKGDRQQNDFQNLFEPFGPYEYQLKPSGIAIKKWETQWRGASNDPPPPANPNPRLPELSNYGIPGDYYRGANASYAYFKGTEILAGSRIDTMLQLKAKDDLRAVESIMDGYDTMVYKYSVDKELYDEDANFCLYRAGGVHLYLAEIFNYSAKYGRFKIDHIMNGFLYSNANNREQEGLRGRVGLGIFDVGKSFRWLHDPYTNKIIGYKNFSGNPLAQKMLDEDRIMDERARELAFEGERFYDLIRVAKRRNDPSYLAEKVSAKFPAGKREQIYNHLLDENNWYIDYFN